MKRAFFSLYIIVVIGIVVIGWGIDRFYQSVNNTPEVGVLDTAFFMLLERQLTPTSAVNLQTQLNQATQNSNLNVNVYTLEDFAQSDFQARISAGEVVLVTTPKGEQQFYHRINKTQYVIKVQMPPSVEPNRYLSEGLLLVFYLGIAAVIYIWVWPLVRDLNSLEQQISSVGKTGATNKIELGPRSAVHNLAAEFNRMQQRIDDLLATYKEMTSAASHELRTPLARMKFALELAEATTDPVKLKKQLASLRVDVNDMEGLVTQLLNYAGFEAQSETLQYEPGDLSALVRELFAGLAEGQKSLSIAHSLTCHMEDVPVYCEWHLMERVLHNVLSNAQKYAEHKIEVSIAIVDDFYEIHIEDDGPGIATSDRIRVFESFVKLQAVSPSRVKGFGLGLAIVKRIMGWHGGTASIVTGDLGGACFVLRWPCTLVNKT